MQHDSTAQRTESSRPEWLVHYHMLSIRDRNVSELSPQRVLYIALCYQYMQQTDKRHIPVFITSFILHPFMLTNTQSVHNIWISSFLYRPLSVQPGHSACSRATIASRISDSGPIYRLWNSSKRMCSGEWVWCVLFVMGHNAWKKNVEDVKTCKSHASVFVYWMCLKIIMVYDKYITSWFHSFHKKYKCKNAN